MIECNSNSIFTILIKAKLAVSSHVMDMVKLLFLSL